MREFPRGGRVVAKPRRLVVDHVLGGGGELGVALDDLVDRFEHVLLGDGLAARADRVHARLRADGAQVGAGAVGAQPRQQLEPDVAVAVDVARVDLEDLGAPLQIRHAKLHTPVHAARAKQRRVEGIRPVGRHQHLDVAAGVEAVELVHDLEHRALHLVVPPLPVVVPRPADSVNLVEEDDAGLLGPSHLEQLAHHPRSLPHILLHQLTANDADEAGIRAVGHRARRERLARPRRPEQQDTLRGVDAEGHELLRVEERELDDLTQLLDRVLAPAHVVVRHVGLVLHLHHGDRRVDLRRKRDLDLVLGTVHPDSHPLLDIGGRDAVPEPDDELGDLLDVDHVLGVVLPRVEDLGAARDLERLLALHHLLVGHHVPHGGGRETCVRLLHPADVVDALVHGADLLLDVLDGVRIWPEPIGLEERDIIFVERHHLLLVLTIRCIIPLVLRLAVTLHHRAQLQAAPSQRSRIPPSLATGGEG
mmetsp:Transcript_60436/g.143179  ORF Transcript_60436/g.143179 Transcript_60436/m.143179 type:complete len:477 (-) Transcript_60436:8-1438(-)